MKFTLEIEITAEESGTAKDKLRTSFRKLNTWKRKKSWLFSLLKSNVNYWDLKINKAKQKKKIKQKSPTTEAETTSQSSIAFTTI